MLLLLTTATLAALVIIALIAREVDFLSRRIAEMDKSKDAPKRRDEPDPKL